MLFDFARILNLSRFQWNLVNRCNRVFSTYRKSLVAIEEKNCVIWHSYMTIVKKPKLLIYFVFVRSLKFIQFERNLFYIIPRYFWLYSGVLNLFLYCKSSRFFSVKMFIFHTPFTSYIIHTVIARSTTFFSKNKFRYQFTLRLIPISCVLPQNKKSLQNETPYVTYSKNSIYFSTPVSSSNVVIFI